MTSSSLFNYDYRKIELPELRYYQQHALTEIAKLNTQKQLFTAPMGAGKSLIMMALAKPYLENNQKVLVSVDRLSIVEQLANSAQKYNIPFGIIQGNHPKANEDALLQIASTQTLARRGYPTDIALYLPDEIHILHKKVKEYIESTTAKVIGFTATPFTKGLGKLFNHNLVAVATMNDLVQGGYLVPFRIFCCMPIDMSGAKIIAGEYRDIDIEERSRAINGDIVKNWLEFGKNRKTVAFGATIRHCTEIAEQFLLRGINAKVYCSDTPSFAKKEILEEFKKENSSIKILVSVEAINRGFDVPSISCVIDARPLKKSLSSYLQAIGRGMRCSENKRDCILLDHTGNIHRFGEDFSSIFYEGIESLPAGEKLEKKIRKEPKEKKIKECSNCGYMPVYKRCLACGFVIPDEPSGIKNDAGYTTEVFLQYAKTERKLWEQCCSYANYSNSAKKQSYACALFRTFTGQYPPDKYKYSKYIRGSITPEFSERVKQEKAKWFEKQKGY